MTYEEEKQLKEEIESPLRAGLFEIISYHYPHWRDEASYEMVNQIITLFISKLPKEKEIKSQELNNGEYEWVAQKIGYNNCLKEIKNILQG